jgi:hypothetical protein
MGTEIDNVMATADEKLDAILDAVRTGSQLILENVGITVNMASIPAYRRYAELRDRLASMSRLRRWLSFVMRERLEISERVARSAIIDHYLCPRVFQGLKILITTGYTDQATSSPCDQSE